ncbi:MAG: hypothetical protein JSS02_31470 [Planctomycetes bacterium]|nr:hypothetical protein [Planctomycetota bacterium]
MNLKLCLALAVWTLAPPDKPVGLIYEFSGQIEVTSKSGQPVTLRPRQLNYVFQGDRLRVGPDAQLTIGFLHDYHWEKLTPGEITIAADHGEPAELCERLEPPAKLRGPAGKHSATTLGSGKGAGLVLRAPVTAPEIPRITPFLGESIASDRPTLTWAPVDDATRYQVAITALGSDRQIWTTQATTPRATYPAEIAPLKRNRAYDWHVTAHRKSGAPQRIAQGRFTVAGPETVKTLESLNALAESDHPVDQQLALVSFCRESADGPALTLAEKLVQTAPSADLYRLLADLYQRAGRPADRDAATELATKLEKTEPPSRPVP